MSPDLDPNPAPQTATVTAQGVFNLPEGSHVVLNRSMSDFMFQVMSSAAPLISDAMQTVDGQTAVLFTANDDLVEMQFDQPLTLPANGDRPQTTYQNVMARFRRTPDGLFEFSTSATGPDPNAPPSYQMGGLSADLQAGLIIFSADGNPQLRVTPSSGPGAPANIEAFTAPYLDQVPSLLRPFAPDTVSLVSVTQVFDQGS